jgi:hypothetical protein
MTSFLPAAVAVFFLAARVNSACICLQEGGVYCSSLSSSLERTIWEKKCGVVKVCTQFKIRRANKRIFY